MQKDIEDKKRQHMLVELQRRKDEEERRKMKERDHK